MDLRIIEEMDDIALRKYVKALLWSYRVADAFWFIYVTEEFGLSAAELINEKVWGRVYGISAKDLIAEFKIKEKGLKGFVKTIKMLPWTLIVGYEIEEKDNQVIVSVPSCPPQEARIKRGLGEYVCKEMHRKAFQGIAKEVDEKIEVECLFAPPDPHPDGLFCKWRFFIQE
jgi:hypothetical protein